MQKKKTVFSLNMCGGKNIKENPNFNITVILEGFVLSELIKHIKIILAFKHVLTKCTRIGRLEYTTFEQ